MPGAELPTTLGSARLARVSGSDRSLLERVLTSAPQGLAKAYLPETGEFAQTVRGRASSDGVVARAEGRNLRYAAMAALGLDRVSEDVQRETLVGRTAGEVTTLAGARAEHDQDLGAVALVAWAEAEINQSFSPGLFDRIATMLREGTPLPTVDSSWMLTAATVAEGLGDTHEIVDRVIERLLAERGARGLFPHWLGPSSQTTWRSHVGSFADQIYPIQALARAYALTGDRALLEAANATARRICELQGSAGQWWWHYDFRHGEVVERFPVYSVHQHAMAPMALFELAEAGGEDHLADVLGGVHWLDTHPEVVEELVSDRFGLVWRKVGRREPPKAARTISAATTALHHGLHLPGLNLVMPPVKVDYECRPYELGWMLYAWLAAPGWQRG